MTSQRLQPFITDYCIPIKVFLIKVFLLSIDYKVMTLLLAEMFSAACCEWFNVIYFNNTGM
jgi:hypothetical protein